MNFKLNINTLFSQIAYVCRKHKYAYKNIDNTRWDINTDMKKKKKKKERTKGKMNKSYKI